MLETLNVVSQLFEEYFSDVIVLPTIGNADTKYHYEPPEDDTKEHYLSFLTDIWFNKHTANINLPNFLEIKETMLEGCWYRVDIPDTNLSVLSLDTMYYNSRSKVEAELSSQKQIDWIRKQLAEAP